jgi:hypothetical protein
LDLRFNCPVCGRPARWKSAAGKDWFCPFCDHALEISARPQDGPGACAVCGNLELYKKKDFPQWLGLSVLAAACLGYAVLGLGFYKYGWAWGVLIGSALLDGLLYLWVGDAVVCYRCGAQHRRFPSESIQPPFDLGISERYRQERIRRSQVEAEKRIAP